MSIRPGVIDIGVDSARFVPGDVDSLLRNYLMMVRRTRHQRRAVSITLRRDDVDVIADHVGQTAAAVLERMADLMGSTRTQRAAMLTLFATGAMLIAVSGSAAAEAPRSTASVAGDVEPPVTLDVSDPSPAGESSDPGIEIDDGVAAATGSRAMAERLIPTSERVNVPAQLQSDSDEVGVIIDDDGEVVFVAVGAPPVPPQFTDTADEPPVQSVEVAQSIQVAQSVEVAQSVQVAQSLDIVEPEETGITDDGSIVAVGLPPVPPLAPPSDDPTTQSTD